MSKERYLTKSAVFIVIQDQKGAFLFQERVNTGYMDGYLDTAASGHVEAGESVSQAACRELQEELGLKVDPADLSFMGVNHRKSQGQVYYDFYFYYQIDQRGAQDISIAEPQKISQLVWLTRDQFNEQIIDYNRIMIDQWSRGIFLTETGW